ncbi:DNA-directed RNA polymerase subunit P [Methanobacterium alkalithermotolerans]|uniref:DNA-directed RNA polymerase subunit Rpo12 n=1 Tax=Methanobacterium alkalithermotolerans TaxID=2731220 RepID=A0A8T8K2M2_9EURY|nr:DNA-directed RNA polymerase subunit P [Methanobacterium alkalithermotolerans]MBU4536282.1 DNA-directed RNA polymerase subunit P [Euryarchaeota archaeon]MBV1729150.1 DNA-directed RNA polymerase subunit P [Methanobacterium sp.]MBU4607489.1 DNA-directed RNA polymerase subunit P [Euryarchaeota archaeon]MBV1754710.1 DNA-directed RNA polymerase subunit P [Methanobacterium sp.]QUH22746.1 DNA-directed RNA polymerase subunit P [Methanobacterium alkalithermotolerans]
MYKCAECGFIIDPRASMENKCPRCRYRILFKEVPVVKRTIKAR